MRVADVIDLQSNRFCHWWLTGLVLLAGLGRLTADAQKVPDGFKAELLYAAPEIEHPSVVTCDDEGNLFVGEDPMDMRGPATEEFDRVLFIKFDAAGQPVRKTVFCDKLSAVFGLCWLDGALYVMHAPHYTMFRDTDGDGVADERKDLADGFGPAAGIFGFNDHIVTGTRLGLDGYVYVSVGDKGIQKATGADGSTITLEGGGVVRMFPDGTRLEVVTSGTRNHLDVAMDSLDNIFTYDNTDDGLGWWTRFTHQIPTGYYGYPYDYHPHPDRHLPRISEHGGGSPVGAAVYREAAWPEQYRDSPFHCEWGKRKIQRFAVSKHGATFDAKIEDFMTPEEGSEFRPQDLCFSPDGKFMYVADWNFGGWMKPDRVGRLYRVSYVGSDVQPEPPRGANSDPPERQLAALAHPAHAERIRAQRVLGSNSANRDALEKVVCDAAAGPRAKVHAIWSLYQLSLPPSQGICANSIAKGLADENADVRGQAARALGELYAIRQPQVDADGYRQWPGAIVSKLADPDAGVRLRAAIAVGQSHRSAPAELFAALADDDDFVRFAVVQALRRIGDWQLAAAYLDSTYERIRTGVLLALTTQYTDAAVTELAAASERAREPAVRAAAISALAEVHLQADPYTTGWWGTQPARSEPARPKKNAWSGTAAVAKAIRTGLDQQDPIVRAAAVRAVRDTKDAESIEAVQRILSAAEPDEVVLSAIATLSALKVAACADSCAEIAGDAQRADALRQAAVEALGALQLEQSIAPLVALVANDSTPSSVMAKCFAALAALKGDAAREALARRLASGPAPLRVQAIEVFAELAGLEGGSTIAAQLADQDPTVREAAIRALGSIGHRESVPAIIALTGDPAYRFVAIAALANIPDPRALGAYLEGVAEKSPELREQSRRALAAIRDKIGDDLVELERRQELSSAARRELKAIYSEPSLVREWQMAGAWPKEYRPEFDSNSAPQLDQPVEAQGKPRKWRQITLAPDEDRFNLLGKMKPTDNAWCVGYTAIESDCAETSELQFGSDDQLTVWFNGAQVYEHRDSRGWGADQARVPVELKAGTNHLWVLVGNDGGPWEFSVRIRRDDPKFAFLNAALPDRPGPEAYREFAMSRPGDALRGRKLFEDKQGVGCIKCHAVGGKGATIGPDLLSVGTKYPRDELIRSVLEPSNRILSGYQVTVVITDDGRTHQGIIKRETPDAIELVDAEGKTITLAVDAISERETANVSMMPNGLKDGLSLEDFADVVGYLESLKQDAGGN